MLPQDRLLSLVGRIYDAGADSNLWPVFLEDFADVIDGDGAGIVHYDLREPRANSGVFSRIDPEQTRQYLDYYSGINPWIKASKARINCDGPESIATSEQLVDFAQLKETEFYNDFLRPYDQPHQFAGMLFRRQDWGAEYFCVRSRKKGPFGQSEAEALRILFPHLQRAMQFHRQLAELEGQHRASIEALNRLPVGVILLDAQCTIRMLNRSAQRIIDQNDGLSVGKNGLTASICEENKKLRSTLLAAALTAAGNGFASGGDLTISRPSGKHPFTLLVMPVAAEAFAPDARRPTVILFVTDPERKMGTGLKSLAITYGLTAAESRVGELLMHGETLVHVADRLGITHNTARTHLQRIYDKTKTSHQGELVRLLLTGTTQLIP